MTVRYSAPPDSAADARALVEAGCALAPAVGAFTCDSSKVGHWFESAVPAGVRVRLGASVVVADVSPRHGTTAAAAIAYQLGILLPQTATSHAAGDRRWRWFRTVESAPSVHLVRGLDLLGEGAEVALPAVWSYPASRCGLAQFPSPWLAHARKMVAADRDAA